MKSFRVYNGLGRKELDLRKELNRFMFGAPDEIAKGALVVLRRMKRIEGIDSPVTEKDLLPCSCKDPTENEPEINCDICDGEGYLFDDIVVPGYKTNRFEYQDIEKYKMWGKNTTSMSFFYVEYFDMISRFDKIIEPVTDRDGILITPLRVLFEHNVHMAERFRSDYGRIEYWRLSCFGQ